jgi:hypothetical protein
MSCAAHGAAEGGDLGASTSPGSLDSNSHRKWLALQPVRSVFLRHRFTVNKPASLRPLAVVTGWPASQELQQILCLRPVFQLSADNAEALVAAVGSRIRAAVPPPCSVVLDLSATATLGDSAAAALTMLAGLLADSHVSLELVLPGAQAPAVLANDKPGQVIRPVTVHLNARAAVLAAYASLPGAALVTPALRQLLAQPPEPLPLPAQVPPP